MSLGGYYSTMHLMTTCGDGQASERLAFGFAAAGLRVHNTCGDRLFFNLATSATTQDDYLAGCSALVLTPLPVAGYQEVTALNLRTTSSSCTSRPVVGVSAWASA